MQVVDAATDAALPTARARKQRARTQRAIPTKGADHTADANGVIRVAKSHEGVELVVWADGYRAKAITLALQPQVVRLHRGYQFEVSVTGSHGAIGGAPLVLSNSLIGWTQHLATDAVGNPLADSPLWVRRTNAEGVARFSGLAAGNYHLRIGDGALCFTDLDATGSLNYQISVPCSDLDVRVHEAVGIAVVAPHGRKIEHVEFRYDWGTTQRSACNNRQRAKALAETLEQRFPGARAVATVPVNPNQRVRVEVFAIADDGLVHTTDWVLLPLSEIEAPVVLTPREDLPTGELLVSVRGPSGQVDAVPIVAVGAEAKFDLLSGTPKLVPAGHYELGLPPRAVWLESAEAESCYVSPGKRTVAVVALPTDVGQVAIEVDVAEQDFDVPLDVVLRGHGASAMQTLMPGERTTFSVPTGTVEVGVVGYAWRDEMRSVRVSRGVTRVRLSPHRALSPN